MDHQALARRYRPAHLTEVIGQEPVVTALTNALTHQRLHHAYLFTGTRGVGKTSIARLLAQCLQCARGIGPTPCGQCNACTSHAQGCMPDFIEIDAASKTKVEDTRALLEDTIYGPLMSPFKIYLIDEVHMLSQHSFNALLKTLEEPPPYIKFLLATTDPQKIPATILSRCIQFSLRPMPTPLLETHLKNVLDQEKIDYDLPGIHALALAAEGSVRDALSLLDQAIHLSPGHVREHTVLDMLGTASEAYLSELMECLARREVKTLSTTLESLQGCNAQQVLKQLAERFHHVALLQQGLKPPLDPLSERLNSLAAQWTPEEVQLYYDLINRARQELDLAPSPEIGLSMALIRLLAFQPMQGPKPTSEPSSQPHKVAPPRAPETSPPRSVAPTPPPVAPPAAVVPTPWEEMLNSLPVKGLTKTLLQHCVFEKKEGATLYFRLESAYSALLNAQQQTLLEEALLKHTGEKLSVHFDIVQETIPSPARQKEAHEQQQKEAASQALHNDPTLQQVLSSFNIALSQDMVEPLSPSVPREDTP